MSQETHTPGPWTLGVDKTSGQLAVANTESDPVLIVCHITPVGKVLPVDEANGHLLAAAPTLLEACEEALEEACERDEDLGANCWPSVRAAIAKARGESS